MAMTVRQGVSPESINLFCKRANRVTLSQIVENVVIQESLWAEGDARRIRFIVDINFYPKEEYKEEHDLKPSEILAAFEYKFPVGLKKEIVLELKKLDADMKSQISQLGIGKKVSSMGVEGEGDEDDDERPMKVRGDDEESVGDGDAEDEKRARQKKQQATYESDSEDEEAEDTAEYDDDAIEAEHADVDPAPDSADTVNKKSEKVSLKSQVSDGFKRHLHQCTTFEFNARKCSFTLEVFASYCFNSRSLP
jgi:DNA-directed RNA polymerase I subunit RPA1